MIVYRLAKDLYCRDLSGRGAEIAGGRWNSKGTPIVYTGNSRALCMVEIAVHTPLGNIPKDYVLVTINIPNSGIRHLDESRLSEDWRVYPHPDPTQLLGDKFVKDDRHLVLRVPSVIIPGEYNYLINPHHKDFKKVRLVKSEPFVFDERLFVR